MKIKCCCCDSNFSLIGHKNKYALLECSSCGFISTAPIPSQEELNKFYDLNYFIKDDTEHIDKGYENIYSSQSRKANLDISKERLEIIESLATKEAILDVGCANGVFLEVAAKKGWKTIEGIEINSHMRKASIENMPRAHLYQSIFEVDSSNKYDVITMWELIEHSRDPVDIIKKIKFIIKTEGLLCMSFPNIESYKNLKAKLNWEQVKPPEHLHYWSTNNIELFLAKYGFTIVGMRYHGPKILLNLDRRFGNRNNKKTILWPNTLIIYKLVKYLNLQNTNFDQKFSKSVRRRYEGIEIYAKYAK